MKVVLVEPGKQATVQTIGSSLEAMQSVVGGNIQAIYPFDDEAALVCNEEGKLMGMPLNRVLVDKDTNTVIDGIVGTFFVCGLGEEDFTDLTDEQAKEYCDLFCISEAVFI